MDYLLKTLHITTYLMYIFYCIVYILIELSHCIYFTTTSDHFHFLMVQFLPASWFLFLPHATLPSVNLRFGFCGIASNLREFWAIALESTPTLLKSDIGPSSLCLIPSSDRYNSILFFALLKS